jgi:hypothetical protein
VGSIGVGDKGGLDIAGVEGTDGEAEEGDEEDCWSK